MEAFEKFRNSDDLPVESMYATNAEYLRARELAFFKAGMLHAAEMMCVYPDDCPDLGRKGCYKTESCVLCRVAAIRKEAGE